MKTFNCVFLPFSAAKIQHFFAKVNTFLQVVHIEWIVSYFLNCMGFVFYASTQPYPSTAPHRTPRVRHGVAEGYDSESYKNR